MTPLIELTKFYYRLGAIDKRHLFRKIYGSPIENIRNYSFLRSLNYYFLSMHVIRYEGCDLRESGQEDNSQSRCNRGWPDTAENMCHGHIQCSRFQYENI